MRVCATGRGQRLKRPAGVSQTLRQLFGLRCYFLRVCEDGDITASDGRGHGLMRSPTDTHEGRCVEGQRGGGAELGGGVDTGVEVELKTRERKMSESESQRIYSLTPNKPLGSFIFFLSTFSCRLLFCRLFKGPMLRPKCLILTLSPGV